MSSQNPYVPPPLAPAQVARIKEQQKVVRYWRASFFLNTTIFFFAPLIVKFQYWKAVWAIGILCAIISGITSWRRWMAAQRRFKVRACEELLGQIFDHKIPLHTFSPVRQLSRDFIQISHLTEDEYAFKNVVDENLLHKTFSQGNIEIFCMDLVDDFGLKKNRNFRGIFGTYTGRIQGYTRNFIATFGAEARRAPVFDAPRDAKVYVFPKGVKGLTEKDPEFELLIKLEALHAELAQTVDLRLMRAAVENRFVAISVWTEDIMFEIPTGIRIHSKAIYPHWRRPIHAYLLLAKFLQKNFVPAREHSEIHWY